MADLAFVFHFQMPTSVVRYQQPVGRAGRGVADAYGALLHGEGDEDITQWFIDSAFPKPEEVEEILGILESKEHGLSVPAIRDRVNISKSRLERAIAMLSLESPAPIVRNGPLWQLTAAEVDGAFWARARRLTERRHTEVEQMRAYVELPFGGHMAFLVRALDGDASTVTGPRLPELPSGPTLPFVNAAKAFLKRTSLPIEPRKRWPAAGLEAYGLRGNIAAAHLAEEGRALCRWGDARWGGLVRAGKYEDEYFADELVAACVELMTLWAPTPTPAWLTCVPSLRHPDLVPDFARRLAEALELPFQPALRVLEARPPQKTCRNAVMQARNLDGALAVDSERVAARPVLLVDDVVDSRWTLTLCAWLLRSHGSGTVRPLALGDAGTGA